MFEQTESVLLKKNFFFFNGVVQSGGINTYYCTIFFSTFSKWLLKKLILPVPMRKTNGSYNLQYFAARSWWCLYCGYREKKFDVLTLLNLVGLTDDDIIRSVGTGVYSHLRNSCRLCEPRGFLPCELETEGRDSFLWEQSILPPRAWLTMSWMLGSCCRPSNLWASCVCYYSSPVS